MATAALSCAGQGSTVLTGADVVVVGEPGRVVVVAPEMVDVVDLLEVVVVGAEPVAVVMSSSGSARTTPKEMTIRVVSRSDARVGTFIVHENNGSPRAAI